jgi:hypothetical protein
MSMLPVAPKEPNSLQKPALMESREPPYVDDRTN